MPRLNGILLATAVITLPLLSTGCVQQDRYDNLLKVNRSLQEQLADVTTDRDSARSTLDSKNQQLEAAIGDLDMMSTRYSAVEGQLQNMSDQNSTLLTRVSNLQIGSLPAGVQMALQDLADAYPNLITFDPEKGMIRFSSDFTFQSGKAELSPDAAMMIGRFSSILNESMSTPYEVVIIGHTDNVAISRSRAQHPTNLHLSVHRAIAVQNAMTSKGLSPSRIQVAGYGEHRPMVLNQDGGTMDNRRVEVFLVPAEYSLTAWTPAETGASVTEVTSVSTDEEPMK
jgi:chemotaxis protein MotB